MRLVCLRCALSKDERTETETAHAMRQHLDEHRAVGHWVPNTCYEDLLARGDEIDEEIRTTYAWSGRGDGDLTVSLGRKGRHLHCSGCSLNENSVFECFTPTTCSSTSMNIRPVVIGHDRVYKGLRRDQAENDALMQRYYDERNVPNRPRRVGWLPIPRASRPTRYRCDWLSINLLRW